MAGSNANCASAIASVNSAELVLETNCVGSPTDRLRVNLGTTDIDAWLADRGIDPDSDVIISSDEVTVDGEFVGMLQPDAETMGCARPTRP